MLSYSLKMGLCKSQSSLPHYKPIDWNVRDEAIGRIFTSMKEKVTKTSINNIFYSNKLNNSYIHNN